MHLYYHFWSTIIYQQQTSGHLLSMSWYCELQSMWTCLWAAQVYIPFPKENLSFSLLHELDNVFLIMMWISCLDSDAFFSYIFSHSAFDTANYSSNCDLSWCNQENWSIDTGQKSPTQCRGCARSFHLFLTHYEIALPWFVLYILALISSQITVFGMSST